MVAKSGREWIAITLTRTIRVRKRKTGWTPFSLLTIKLLSETNKKPGQSITSFGCVLVCDFRNGFPNGFRIKITLINTPKPHLN